VQRGDRIIIHTHELTRKSALRQVTRRSDLEENTETNHNYGVVISDLGEELWAEVHIRIKVPKKNCDLAGDVRSCAKPY
jgi:hypothetical protein